MNKTIIALSIATAAVLGFFAGKYQREPAPAAVSIEVKQQPSAEHPQTELSATGDPQPQELLSADAKSSSKEIQKPTISDISAQETIDTLKAEYELAQRSESFANWLTRNQKDKPWFDLGATMAERFENEDKDYNWAISKEGDLQTLFSQERALGDVALKSTHCKATQCRITVGVIDRHHANEVAMAISRTFAEKYPSQIIVDTHVDTGEAIFYLSRSDNGFEFN